MIISHTKCVRLFCQLTGFNQALVQQMFTTVKEAYLGVFINRMMNSINDTVDGALIHLQDDYGQLMPHAILEREDIPNKTMYHPRDPIVTIITAVKELLDFSNINGAS